MPALSALSLFSQDCNSREHTYRSIIASITVPAEGTIVVNLGDAMQVWTNDAYVAAVHRVLPQKVGSGGRFSTPYFFNPTNDAVLEPLPALLSGSEPLYRTFTWREYIKGRVDDNYTDLGEEDIQIAQYRVA